MSTCAAELRVDLQMPPSRLIEVEFPIAAVSCAAAAALERKELKDPVNHAHRWWGRRPAVVMEAVLRAALEPASGAASPGPSPVVLDPMMGGGTTISVARQLGLQAVGQDINPVAYRIVSTLHQQLDLTDAEEEFLRNCSRVLQVARPWYETKSLSGRDVELICYLWALEVPCPKCRSPVMSRTQIPVGASRSGQPRSLLCMRCLSFQTSGPCGMCGAKTYSAGTGCCACGHEFKLAPAARAGGFSYRLAAKVVRDQGARRYLPADAQDLARVQDAVSQLGALRSYLPSTPIRSGHTSSQVLGWGCRTWSDLYLPRQLVVLGLLAREFSQADERLRSLFALTLSTAAEFNSALCSYRGEGQGAIRPAFWAQFLRLEPVAAEAPILAPSPTSGSVQTLFQNRLLRALRIARRFEGSASLHFGSSHQIALPSRSVTAVVTDPPFGDSVNYDDLADYFNAWHRVLYPALPETTKAPHQVQDGSPGAFAANLGGVLRECERVMQAGAVAAYTFTHKDPKMWVALAGAAELGGLRIVRSYAVLTDASFSMISYCLGERSQTNAVLVLRRAAEVPAILGDAEEAAAEAAAEAATQLAALQAGIPGFVPSEGDVLTAVYGCAIARIADVPRDAWGDFCARARALCTFSAAPARAADASSSFSARQMSLF